MHLFKFKVSVIYRTVLGALLVLLLVPATTSAQQKFTVNGYVKDKATGEELIGATVSTKELPASGTATNGYGFYSLTLPAGKYQLVVTYVGYQTFITEIELTQNLKRDISISDNSQELQEAVIVAEKAEERLMSTETGVQKLDLKEVSKIPVLFGEKDILKTIQLTPGVKGAGEGNSGFYVRGGSADQNLILLDEAPVYNASHLFGFFSTFNSDAIKDATLYKGNMPAQYGGRLASVLDLKMNEGNNQDYHVSGGIGTISSKLNVEGPIVKDKGSFLLSGRRTYADLFLKLSSDESISNNKLYFYDFNAKANYKIDDNNRIFLSGYFGRDNLSLGSTFGIDWGNATGTLRWNHIINNKWFSNTSLIYSNFKYKISIKSNDADFSLTSNITDYNLKQEFQYYPNPDNNIRIGFNTIYHNILPGQVESEGTTLNDTKLENRYAWENAVYANNDWKVNSRMSFNYGLRLTAFSAVGAGSFYSYDNEGNVIDTTVYAKGDIVKTYFNLEPRLAFTYLLNSVSSVKIAYSRNVQNLHLISNSTTGSPTDLWIPSSNNTQAEIGDQLSLGYYRNLFDDKFELSVETYYKYMQNQVDYRDGADVNANELVEGELLYGLGRAYGLEVFFKKRTGKFTGWISYTLSRSERQIDGINNNEWYAARQDRTHDLSLVGIYDLSKKWSLSATWVYYTGNAVTFPSGKYFVDNNVQYYYTERNGYRMPNYHRLDLSATLYGKKTKKYQSEWNFSLYNAYGRMNAYIIEFRVNEADPSKTEAVQTSLFRWVPSVTYNFRF
jgi:hypothetical protein